MTTHSPSINDRRASLPLRLAEPSISPGDPWTDDVLERDQLASKLTHFITNRHNPLSIGIHGEWGTGKTFLLKRWKHDLARADIRVIYFNAWEDDFCNDPLLAILGQISALFKGSAFDSIARQALAIAVPLLHQNAINVLKATTGITFDLQPTESTDPIDEYWKNRSSKDALRSELEQLAQDIYKETGHPLVFIIDELDRCRPTFAVDLLERVKHIFSIDHMVFVFGLNRNELCTSLQSIYGAIDSDTYLRRFFDIEFTLPPPDSRTYCRHVIDRFELKGFFESLSSESNSSVHRDEYRLLIETLPDLCSGLNLSLRDIEHCVSSVAIVGKHLETGHYMFPLVLGVLITTKLKNPDLYRRFIRHECLASEVLNYIHNSIGVELADEYESNRLDRVEVYLYFAENRGADSGQPNSAALSQLDLLAEGSKLTHPGHLSERIKEADQDRIKTMINLVQSLYNQHWSSRSIIEYLASLVDFHQPFIRR